MDNPSIRGPAGPGRGTQLSRQPASQHPDQGSVKPLAPLRVGILGSGLIGSDLLLKALRSRRLVCTALIGRSQGSPGHELASRHGIPYSCAGIDYLVENPNACDIVFDATSAESHKQHLSVLSDLRIPVIDLTPARLGQMCVPAIDDTPVEFGTNLNMVTCGGQAAIPIAWAIATSQTAVDYIEVASCVASKSAGMATRNNIDEYIQTTEAGLRFFTGIQDCKTTLNLNPANPCIDMQVTVIATVPKPDISALASSLRSVVQRIQTYTPGYRVAVGPIYCDGNVSITVRVKGAGDLLPSYAGNLDIINCAALGAVERMATTRLQSSMQPLLTAGFP